MSYFFTSESVSEGHPDKVADQISDAIIDNFLAFDPQSKVACETLVTTGQVILAGEVKSSAYLDVQSITRDVIQRIGYTKSEYMFEANSCGVLSAIHDQSDDINRGVDRGNPEDQGAGDQGMMFGYTTNETENFIGPNFALHQNIPNPFSDLTAIYFELPESTEASIQFFDVTGKSIKIIEGNYKKGLNIINKKTEIDPSSKGSAKRTCFPCPVLCKIGNHNLCRT